jgi:ABC-type transporter Mla MlaB component
MSLRDAAGPLSMGRDVLVLDLSSLGEADAGTVGTLALLRLVAKSGGIELRLRRASRDLRELVRFMGLDEALGLEPGWQPETGEEALRVEKEGELGDPAG